jgi:hypothetical protein
LACFPDCGGTRGIPARRYGWILRPEEVRHLNATFLGDPEIEAVAEYVIVRLQGKGEPTREDCIAFWDAESHECAAMK